MIKNNKKPWLLLLPGLFIMIATVFIPVIRTFVFSLQRYNLTDPTGIKFIGLKNYIEVFKDPDFMLALKNSLIIIVLVLILTMISSLAVGLLLNKKTKITAILTAIAILPWALPPLVNGIMWKFIFYPGYGFANKILLNLNIISTPISFTNNLTLLLLAISMAVQWRASPFCSLIILSSLQSIPDELYEAASIDGCNKWQKFKAITLPMISPSLFIVVINILMVSINVFDEVIAIVGYRFDSQNLLTYNYLHTFSYLDFGYGSAVTYVILLISALIGFLYIRNMVNKV